MTIDDLDTDDRRRLLKWAVVEHYRSWLCFDGPELVRVRANGNRLSPQAVQRIAREYNILRATPNGTSKPEMAENIARLLDREIGTHPDDMLERARRCVWLAQEAKRLCYLTKFEASGMTKLMWFLKPGGWTVYDNFAATAVGSEGKTTIDRMEQFYLDLSERNFVNSADDIQEVLSRGGWRQLHGERVIDKFLWLCGADEQTSNNVVETCRAVVTLLPNGVGDQLERTAREIAEQYAHGLLTH